MNGVTYCYKNDVQSCDLILPVPRFYFVFFFQLLSKFGCCCLVAKHVWLFATPWTVCSPLLCSWDFPGKNPGVSCHFLLHGIFLTQGSNQDLLHCWWILYHWDTQEAPVLILYHNQLISVLLAFFWIHIINIIFPCFTFFNVLPHFSLTHICRVSNCWNRNQQS